MSDQITITKDEVKSMGDISRIILWEMGAVPSSESQWDMWKSLQAWGTMTIHYRNDGYFSWWNSTGTIIHD